MKNRMVIGLIAGVVIGLVIGVIVWVKCPKVVYYEFDTVAEEREVWEYMVLPCEMSDYICELCRQLDLDSDLVVSILLRENPDLNTDAMHRNLNGTIDCGLFQLNDKYLYNTFIPRYWKIPEEFDVFNWKMNTYLAIHHIDYLRKEMKVFDDIVCSYNAGEGAVMRNEVPQMTYAYLAAVKKNYKLLGERNGQHKE